MSPTGSRATKLKGNNIMNEAQLARLSEFDFIICLDASGSMSTEDMPNNRSRWAYMQETLLAFARDITKIDADGFDLVIFGGTNITSHQGVTADKIADVLGSRRPMGSTPLAEALTSALKLAGKSNKKDFILVFTDGEPDNKDAAAKVIRDAANGLTTDDELTILFVQVGRDAGATNYLRGLDDNLKGAKFDIVDAKTQDEAEQFASTADLIDAAIND